MADGNEGIGGGDAGGLFAGRTEDLINVPPLIGISVSTRAERSVRMKLAVMSRDDAAKVR
jgi:hypothetical protein